MSSVLFLSDAHLGVDPQGALPHRTERLEEFLRAQQGKISHLFIVGDLFEFWMEYRFVIPKGSLGVLSAIRELSRSGVDVHYSAGNHDFNLGRFFEEELGVHCHSEPFRIELQGQRLWIAHGDGLASHDGKYRLLKRMLTHRLSNALWKWLHPDLGMALAHRVGALSRKKETDPELARAEYSGAVQKILDQGDLDAVVLGHTHLALIEHLDGGLFVNTGEWIVDPTWVRLENGAFRIEKMGRSD